MRISRTGTAAVVTAAALFLVAAPGAEAAAYRYWTYWQGASDTWTFASAGPAALVPADGTVEGWRFAVTTQAGGQSDAPSVEPSFEAICGDTPAQPDRKRVALVIDPGSTASAPQGQRPPPASSTCIVAELDATGYQVLRSAVVVRTEGGLVCGIAGYPTGECAPVVDEAAAGTADAASPDPSASQAMPSVAAPTDAEGSDTPWWTIAVLAVVAVIGGLLVWRRPRG
jgi:hypothetical protein